MAEGRGVRYNGAVWEVGRVARTQRANVVVDRVNAMIASRGLRPGESIGTLQDLCRACGASLPTVRRALYLMQQDGAVVVRTGQQGGVYVADAGAQPMLRGIQQVIFNENAPDTAIQEMRLLLETGAVWLAADRVTEAELEPLMESVHKLDALVGQNPHWFLRENLRFHDLVVQASHNILLTRVYESFERLMYPTTLYEYTEAAQREVVRSHRLIVEALAQHNRESARRRMNKHLEAFFAYRTFHSRLPEEDTPAP